MNGTIMMEIRERCTSICLRNAACCEICSAHLDIWRLKKKWTWRQSRTKRINIFLSLFIVDVLTSYLQSVARKKGTFEGTWLGEQESA